MVVTLLDVRRKKVFQAIVESYIELAVPVSSQAIAQRLRFRVSPATVRNIMGELDELGLIWQPHTSAGRIPTSAGYRYYIDSLLEVEQLSQEEKELIEKGCFAQNEALDSLLSAMLKILSNFSGYTALAFSSGIRAILFKKLELISLHSQKILVVLISQSGLVKTVIADLPFPIDQLELAKVAKILNEELQGLDLDQIKERLATQLLTVNDSAFGLFKKALQVLELTFSSFEQDRLYLEGTSCILGQPEFQDTQKLQIILKTFEQEQYLLEIMRQDSHSDGIKVHIGKENTYDEISDCSLIVSNFKIKNNNIGAVGIIGPIRMPYARAISAVNYVAQILSEKIKDFSV